MNATNLEVIWEMSDEAHLDLQGLVLRVDFVSLCWRAETVLGGKML